MWAARPRFEKTVVTPCKRIWSRLTQFLCPIRKEPPRSDLSSRLQGSKVCLLSLTYKGLLESHSKGTTQTTLSMCERSDLQGLSEGNVCRAGLVETPAARSMKRRVWGGCSRWCTCASVAQLSSSSRPWIIGAAVVNTTLNLRRVAEGKTFRRAERRQMVWKVRVV